jgi:hypothetical protein
MSEKEIKFERSVYRNTASVVLALAVYVTTLGIAHPLLVYGVGIVVQVFVVGGIRSFRSAIKENRKLPEGFTRDPITGKTHPF